MGLQHRRDVALELPGVAGIECVDGQDHHRDIADVVDHAVHRLSLVCPLGRPALDPRPPGSPVGSARVAHGIDAVGHEGEAEAGGVRAVKGGRRDGRGVEGLAVMRPPDRNLAGESLGFQVKPLIGAALVGMLQDSAGGLADRQLSRRHTVGVERRAREIATPIAHEGAGAAERVEIAAAVDLRTPEGERAFSHFDGHTGEVIGQLVRPRERDDSVADGVHHRVGLEIAVDLHAFHQALDAKQVPGGVAGFRDAIGVQEPQVAGREGDGELGEELAWAETQRSVVAVHEVAAASLRLPVPDARRPAIDQGEASVLDV